MTDTVPRLRMFAGPNGSGKTTIKSRLQKPPAWFGIYINPDDIEQTIRSTGFLNLEPYQASITTEEIQNYFATSSFLQSQNLLDGSDTIVCRDSGIDFSGLRFTSYHASVLSDFLRRKALEAGKSFSFETVMSAHDKVDLLRDAQQLGFRTYLYFIATEAPEINIQRVKNRVADGGHDVPEAKIVERYYRSLGLLAEAIRWSSRAFLFDSSSEEPWFFAEVVDGKLLDVKDSEIPNWFEPINTQLDPDPI